MRSCINFQLTNLLTATCISTSAPDAASVRFFPAVGGPVQSCAWCGCSARRIGARRWESANGVATFCAWRSTGRCTAPDSASRTRVQTTSNTASTTTAPPPGPRPPGPRYTYHHRLIGPIPWGHSGLLCHALSLSSTSMRRRRATLPLATSAEWA